MSEISVKVGGAPGAVTVELSGELDSTTSAGLYEQLEPLVTAQEVLCLELSGVGYVSSAGLRDLVLLHRRAEQARAGVRLTGLSEELKFVMAATGFLDLFDVAPEAARELHRGAA